MNDTVKLLRECNAGIKMGKSAIDRVIPKARASDLRNVLTECKNTHAELGDKTHTLLLRHNADTKDPHAMARMMSDVKICAKMAMHESDKTIADVITDGCNMGVKSLSKYLNQYKAASPEAKDIARKLIDSEINLGEKLRGFL